MLLGRTMELAPLARQISRMAHDRNNSLMQLRHNLRRPALLPLDQPVLPTPRVSFPVDPDGIHSHSPRANNIKRIPADDPNPRQTVRIIRIHPDLPRKMMVNLRRRLESLHLLHGNNVLENASVLFQVGRFGDAAADHGVGAVGEDDGVDVRGRAQLLTRAGHVREDGEAVVGLEQGLQLGLGQLEGVFRQGVFQRLDGYVGEVFVLACSWGGREGVRFRLLITFLFCRSGDNSPMLFRRQVYSSWYLRHAVARVSAFSSPKWCASFFAMLSVESKVP